MAAFPEPAAARTARHQIARFTLVSAALLLPVFWHRRIEAGDLASHLYNAWLVQLIQQGKAPGLWIAHQWNNVLFDWLLSWFGAAFGLHAAERIAVSLAVLVFFWGAFALIAAATRRAPWTQAPLLAAISYGWTFEMGFMNYYLSLGLCFFVLAAFWPGAAGQERRTSARLLSVVLIPLIWVAHPLGIVCLAAIGAYAVLAKFLVSRYQWYLLLVAGIVLFGVRVILARHFDVKYNDLARYLFYNGADQLVLFAPRYFLVFAAIVLTALFVLGDDVGHGRWRTPGFWQTRAVPLQLYIVTLAAPLILPNTIYLPQYSEPLSFLSSRLTSLSAVLLCWAFAAARPRRWHAATYAAIAIVFFAFLYVDTGKLNRLEAQVEEDVAALAPGHRVVEYIDTGQEMRVFFEHIVDRACIGHCFSFSNYEPYGGQFRVRANPGNSIVTADPPNDLDDESEAALVKALNPPVYQVVWCDQSQRKLCLRELSIAEVNELVKGDF